MQNNNEPINLDDFLASRFFDVEKQKLNTYEAILAALLRKYVPKGKKIELNLLHSSNDTLLDVTLNDQGIAKISWGDDNVSIK